MSNLSRRRFLQSAGGASLLALTPVGRGVFAATNTSSLRPAPPLITALPYVQPGNNSQLINGRESIVIAWQTEAKPGDFKVEYGDSVAYGRTAAIERVERWSGDPEDGENRYLYAARPSALKLGTRYFYRVWCNGSPILAGYFTTRQPRGQHTRFVAFGDNSFGDVSDRAIAFQAYRQNPDFVMNTGDNVYDGGLNGEYERFFFPVYNAEGSGPRIGAPLLRSVPFYSVIANHDVHDKDTDKHPAADFSKNPDSLAYYTALHLPLNGPIPVQATPAIGDTTLVTRFRNASGDRFPRMANYSYDYGDLHFLCLDSNLYVDPTDKGLQDWIESDLSGTTATWKFVVFHHPAFNVGREHYSEQHMRALSPLFEKHGVDITLHGHEHSYQRPRPFYFAPRDLSKAAKLGSKDRLVPGDFTIDTRFDGDKHTRPEGILYLTTGAGGKHLYDAEWNENPARWIWPEDNNVAYIDKFISDRHSLTVFDVHREKLEMKQIDEFGKEIDRIVVTKS